MERPRIGRWLKKGVMPKPYQRLQATPIWERKTIMEFKRERDKLTRQREKARAKAAA